MQLGDHVSATFADSLVTEITEVFDFLTVPPRHVANVMIEHEADEKPFAY
jgi:hypothetical protein